MTPGRIKQECSVEEVGINDSCQKGPSAYMMDFTN